jgi:hypothetical protein
MAKSERAIKKEVDLKEANAAVFYKAFRSMDTATRRRLALRILKDEAVLEDLYDHFLIQDAEKERGRSVPWEEYLAKRQRRNN